MEREKQKYVDEFIAETLTVFKKSPLTVEMKFHLMRLIEWEHFYEAKRRSGSVEEFDRDVDLPGSEAQAGPG